MDWCPFICSSLSLSVCLSVCLNLFIYFRTHNWARHHTASGDTSVCCFTGENSFLVNQKLIHIFNRYMHWDSIGSAVHRRDEACRSISSWAWLSLSMLKKEKLIFLGYLTFCLLLDKNNMTIGRRPSVRKSNVSLNILSKNRPLTVAALALVWWPLKTSVSWE